MLKVSFKVKDKSKQRDKNLLKEVKHEPGWDEMIAAVHDMLEYFIIHHAL